jgi:hypothetical protein
LPFVHRLNLGDDLGPLGYCLPAPVACHAVHKRQC